MMWVRRVSDAQATGTHLSDSLYCTRSTFVTMASVGTGRHGGYSGGVTISLLSLSRVLLLLSMLEHVVLQERARLCGG
jgi:hypothetical protein